ncbi:MAG: hypothetical protein U1E36_07020 [Rickettsiales bacterium]
MPLPPPFIGEKWWQVGWTNGKSPYTHQPFNAGWSFYNYSSSDNSPERYISYMGGGDFNGGGVVQAWSATTNWDRIIGGPLSNGPNKITKNSQLDFGNSAQTRYWWASADRYPDMWLGIYLVVAPSARGGISEDQFYQNWVDIVAGRHDADYVMMGRRMCGSLRRNRCMEKCTTVLSRLFCAPTGNLRRIRALDYRSVRYLEEKRE